MLTARKVIAALLIVVLLLPLLSPFVPMAKAGELAQTTVRLDRMKTNTATGGMVCVRTPGADNGTEASVAVAFPSDFTLNSTASNYIVTTSNLLSGASAWPGIGTATNVSGTTVTFPSSNLSANTLYCFNFSGTNTVTTGAAGAGVGSVTTQAGGGSTIDAHDYGVTIRANDQVTVTASIAANPNDFEADLTLANTGDNFPQDTELDFTLTYGSNLSSAQPIDVVAEWSQGTIFGSGTPTVDVLEYVTGSASNAYNSTPPVIDTVNRTITWSIASFPANTTGETVTFSLRTTDAYTGSSTVAFTVAGRVESTGTSTPDSEITRNYLYDTSLVAPTPTNTPQPGNTATPGPQATSTQTPTPAPSQFAFRSIRMQTITDTTAQIAVQTTKPASLVIEYGKGIKQLTERLRVPEQKSTHDVTLTDLTNDTKYYFRIIATDASGRRITSDIYTFTTAVVDESPAPNLSTLLFLSQNNVIFTAQETATTDNQDVIILPRNIPFQFRFAIEKPDLIESVQAVVRNRDILGASTTGSLNDQNTELLEVKDGIFTGSLRTSATPGYYVLFARIKDYNGNLKEHELITIRVVDPLIVVTKGTNQPVEKAKVLISRLNPKTKIYEFLSPQTLPITNPAFSKPNGEVEMILTEGVYRAEISAIGYQTTTVDFTIGLGKDEIYPLVYLEKEPFSLLTLLRSISDTILDLFMNAKNSMTDLAQSSKLFEFLSAFGIVSFLSLFLLALSAKSGVSILSLPIFMLLHLMHLFKGSKQQDMFAGTVVDEKNTPIANASIYVKHKGTQHVLTHATTGSDGSFRFRQLHHDFVTVTVLKDGYDTASTTVSDTTKPIKLKLREHESALAQAGKTILFDIQTLLQSTFGMFLLGAILLQMLHALTFGFSKTIPFLAISLMNLLLWFLYVRDQEAKVT